MPSRVHLAGNYGWAGNGVWLAIHIGTAGLLAPDLDIDTAENRVSISDFLKNDREEKTYGSLAL